MKNIIITTESKPKDLLRFFDYLDTLYVKRLHYPRVDDSILLMVTVEGSGYTNEQAGIILERGFVQEDKFKKRNILFESGRRSLSVEDHPNITIEFV